MVLTHCAFIVNKDQTILGITRMSTEKNNVPRFYVASKIKNMVKNIPIGAKGKPVQTSVISNKDRENDTIHSFHINESQQKPFLDCDSLFTDCEEFLKLSHRSIEINNNKGKSGLSKLVHAVPISDKISKWRSKKKDNDLYVNYEAIQSRVDDMESTLSGIGEVSATTTSALITQSVHLNVRLTSCIDYNRLEVDKHKPLVAEGRTFLNKLKTAEKSMVSMLNFLEEVEELKRTEPKAYIPWALRQKVEDEAEAEKKASLARNELVELKKESLERRIRKLRKIIDPVERVFKITEQQQHARLNILSHCLRSQLALLNFLHRCQSASASTPSAAAELVRTPSGKSVSSASSTGSPLPPPPPAAATAPKTGGFMNFANPIKAMQGRATAGPGSAKPPGATAPAAYKPTLAELAAGILPGGSVRTTDRNSDASSSNRSSETSLPSARNSETSAAASAVKTATANVTNASFDHDDDESEVEEDDEQSDAGDDPANPDNKIEKAVRHMRVALTSLQRNSGLVMEKVPPYDHCNCSDCSVVYDMANDCCMHIAAANFRSKQCTERMQRLAAYRERMKENAELLDSQESA